MQKHEERIGVRIPGQGYHMVTALVGTLESDEEVLARISKIVGTVFNVSGTKYELLSSTPYRLKRLPNEDEEGSEEVAVVAEPPKREEEVPKKEPQVKVDKPPKPPKPIRPPEEEKKIATPQVGERWKPRDPRRIATFTVVAIEGDHVVTDDGRKIQLARFPRYERVL